MSEINEPQDGEYCSICRGPATAVWRGAKAIPICPQCAVEDLPALIADSIVLPGAWGLERALSDLKRIELRYWRALALRLLRERKPQ